MRHDKGRDLLAQLIRECQPTATVAIEVPLQTTDPQQIKTADIYFSFGGTSYAVDVAYANPSSPSYIDRGSDHILEIAGNHRASAKRQEYSRIRGLVSQGRFFAFTVEASGRVTRESMQLVDLIVGQQQHKKKRFLAQLNVITANSNGQCIT